MNTRALNQFPSKPEPKGKESNQINLVIEVTIKQLTDPPLNKLSSEKLFIFLNEVVNCDSFKFVKIDTAKDVNKKITK